MKDSPSAIISQVDGSGTAAVLSLKLTPPPASPAPGGVKTKLLMT